MTFGAKNPFEDCLNREFFIMSAEAAYELLETIAIISGTTDKLHKVMDNPVAAQKVRKPAINFAKCGIPVGAANMQSRGPTQIVRRRDMPYPKPLTEKTLSKKYEEAGITVKQRLFLIPFLSACANLYGVITAEEAWDVYRELSAKTETPRLHRRDMYAAIGILRRETVPFFVFEAEEVFEDEERSDKYRVIAAQELISEGYGKFSNMYRVMDAAEGKPFYVPADFLKYAKMPESKYERELLDMLGRLKSTLAEYEDRWGQTHLCQYTGKRLKEFSYVSSGADFELRRLRGEVDGYKGNVKKAVEYEAELNSITAAQYLVNSLKRRSSIGYVSTTKSLECFFDDLTAMGVSFSGDKQVNAILRVVNDMRNNQHLWCNHGWTPHELSAEMAGGIPTMSFGPGMQRAFADGTLDKDAIVRRLEDMGIEVLK